MQQNNSLADGQRKAVKGRGKAVKGQLTGVKTQRKAVKARESCLAEAVAAPVNRAQYSSRWVRMSSHTAAPGHWQTVILLTLSLHRY